MPIKADIVDSSPFAERRMTIAHLLNVQPDMYISTYTFLGGFPFHINNMLKY